MILTVVTFMYCPFSCEKILTFYVCFFSSMHTSRQTVVATLKYFGYKTVNDVPLPLKEIEFGIELLSKEFV